MARPNRSASHEPRYVLVAGDPGRNQSRAYMSNHVQGPPTSRRVVLPRDWAKLLRPKSD